MAYTTINGKLVKTNKTFKMDPNVKEATDLIRELTKGHKGTVEVRMNFTHMEPVSIDTDTATHYKACYEDKFGPYNFEIHKTDKGYTVISDGNICSKDDPDREHIIWNYENQVAARMPKVLEVV